VARFTGTVGQTRRPAAHKEEDTRDWPSELRLAVRSIPAGLPPATPDEARRLLRRPGVTYGEAPVEEVRLREHPYGLHGRYVARYGGSIRVSRGGEWLWRVISFGPSFLFVDGREVLSAKRNRRRTWSLRVQQTEAAARLSAGTHSVECLYFNTGAPPYLDLLARPPGQEGFEPLAETYWVKHRRPAKVVLTDAAGRPFPFLLTTTVRPATAVGTDVRSRVLLRPCLDEAPSAGCRIAVDGREVESDHGLGSVWLAAGSHTATLDVVGPQGKRTQATQTLVVRHGHQVEPLDLQVDASALPVFAYSGNGRRLQVALRSGNAHPLRIRYVLRNPKGHGPGEVGLLQVGPTHGAVLGWDETMPRADATPMRKILSFSVWGHPVATEKVVLLPFKAWPGTTMAARAGSLHGPGGERLVLVKRWQVRTTPTWPLVRWVSERLHRSPKSRTVLVAGLPGDSSGWRAYRHTLDALRSRNVTVHSSPSVPAPWPCLHDFAALRHVLASKKPHLAVISLGWWDAVVGTPLETFSRAVDFSLAFARARCRRVVVVLPGRRTGTSLRQPYVVAAQEVARRHGVACVEAWGKGDAGTGEGAKSRSGFRWPPLAAQRELVRRVSKIIKER
jgi:hypothetical protein